MLTSSPQCAGGSGRWTNKRCLSVECEETARATACRARYYSTFFFRQSNLLNRTATTREQPETARNTRQTAGMATCVRTAGRRNSRRLPRAKVPFRHPLLWRSASMYPEDACDARAGRAESARSEAESRQPPSTGGSRSAEKKPRRTHREQWGGGGRRCMHAQ